MAPRRLPLSPTGFGGSGGNRSMTKMPFPIRLEAEPSVPPPSTPPSNTLYILVINIKVGSQCRRHYQAQARTNIDKHVSS